MAWTKGRGLILLAGWGLCLGSASAPGCGIGVSAESICEEVCDCTGCSNDEQDDCRDAVEDAEEKAKDEGCEDDYEAYASCALERLDCDDEQVDLGKCDDEAEDLAECIGGKNLPFRSACSRLKSECNDCGDAKSLCQASVDLLEELSGEEGCQEALDAGGITCAGDGGGGEGGGGEGGSGGAGGAPPGGCDTGVYAAIDSQTCGDCITCSQGGACAFEWNELASHPDYAAYNSCYQGCTTSACYTNCDNTYPAAANLFITAASCSVCIACPSNCDAATNCS